MRIGGIIRVFAVEYSFATEGIDESCAAWNTLSTSTRHKSRSQGEPTGSRSAADHQTELDTFLDILLSSHLDL